MKPRELFFEENLEYKLYFESLNGAPSGDIHFREVIPIDWKMIWDGMELADGRGELQDDKQVQNKIIELVEKHLRGEE